MFRLGAKEGGVTQAEGRVKTKKNCCWTTGSMDKGQ